MKFTITITRDEDGAYIAECPAIPGKSKGSDPLNSPPGPSTSSRTGLGGQHDVKEAVPFVLRRRVMRDAWRRMK